MKTMLQLLLASFVLAGGVAQAGTTPTQVGECLDYLETGTVLVSSNTSATDLYEVSWQCTNDTKATTYVVDCSEGPGVILDFSCGGHLVQSCAFRCPGADKDTTTDRSSPSTFHWSLGASATGIWGSGLSAYAVEGVFSAELRLSEDWWFLGSFGAGVGFLNSEKAAASMTDFLGIQARTSQVLYLEGGFRHRVFLDGHGDTLQTLGGELRLRLNLSDNVSLLAIGQVGNAWFETEDSVEGLVLPAGVLPPTKKVVEETIFGGFGLQLQIGF